MISCFLDPYPEELFYSVCARFRVSRRYSNNQTVAQVLFGERSVCAVVDFPCHLGYLVDHLPPGRQYTIDTFISKYTLFPVYQPFLPPERVQQIREQMIVGSGKSIHRKIGIGNSTVTLPKVLRYCPACAAIERETLGECYWHRLHQVPGVMICPEHEMYLEDSEVPTRTPWRTNTFFAAEESIPDIPPRSAKVSPYFKTYKQLALSIAELLCESLPGPEVGFWREQYIALMARQGYVTSGGLFRCAEFLQAFLRCFPLDLLSQLGCHIQMDQDNWDLWWASLRGSLRYVSPPLYHLLTLHVLGVKVSDFFRQRYRPPTVFGEGPWPCLNPICTRYRQSVIVTCQISEHTQRRKPMGRFACSCGFTYSRSGPDQHPDDHYKLAKVIAFGSVWEGKLSEFWSDASMSLREISQRLGFTVDTINRQAKHLGLLMPRQTKGKYPQRVGIPHPRPGKDVTWYRQQWLSAVQAHPDASHSELRRLLPGVYSWLQRHDQAWLNQHLPSPRLLQRVKQNVFPTESDPSPPVTQRPGDDDVLLASLVRATEQQFLLSPERPVRISKRRLLLALPVLTVLHHALERFPLTAQAVEECQETRESFGLRRVRWALQRYSEEKMCPTRTQFEERSGLVAMRAIPVIHRAVDEAMQTLERFKGHGLAFVEVRDKAGKQHLPLERAKIEQASHL